MYMYTKRDACINVPGEMAFKHNNQPLTLRQYYEMYKMSLPSFISVTQGYYGGNEMEVLGNGQVRLHMY